MAVFAALALIVSACTDDDSGTTEATSAPTTTAAPTTTDGSGTTAAPTTAPETTEPTETGGGVFTTALVADLTTNNFWAYLDPESSVHNGYVLGQSHPALYTLSIPDFLLVPGTAAEMPPALAQEGENWVATIPLREGMVWSDGEPVTAGDYVFTMNTIKDLELGSNWISYHPFKDAEAGTRWLENVEAIDDYTLKLTFAASDNAPGLALYQNGVLQAPMLPEHFWADIVTGCMAEEDPKACLYATDGTGEPSAGTDIFSTWEPGAFASIVANPDYYYAGVTYTVFDDLTFNQAGGAAGIDETYGPGGSTEILSQYADGPFVSEVIYSEYGGQDAAYLAFLEGDVDYVLNPSGVPSGRRDQLLAEPGLEFAVNPSEGFRYLAFNLRKSPMNIDAFRQALAYVIDKEFLMNSVLAGAGIPIYSLVPEANAAWYTDEVNKWGSGIAEGERFDMAVQLLKDAGFTWDVEPLAQRLEDDPDTEADESLEYSGVFTDGQGMRTPDGNLVPELELLTPGPGYDPLRSTVATWIGVWGDRLGIPIDVNPTDFNTIVDLTFPPQEDGLGWDMYILGWGGGDPSLPCTSHQAFFGADQDAVGFGGFNTPGYNNAEFEALSDAHDLATTVEEARGICNDMEKNISENLPYIVLFSTPLTDVWRAGVEFPITDVLGGLNAYPNAWVGQVKVTE
ncbi:MAG: ABC transporter substrate-binding protein [Actinobacteria bacterium]|nr:ABC transporter substrate-binding protein [Actinomycetota bacterium]